MLQLTDCIQQLVHQLASFPSCL